MNQNQLNSEAQSRKALLLWGATGILLLALLFARAIYPELLAVSIVIAVLLIATLGVLIVENQKALRSRSAAYGLNSIVTVLLVLGILGVINFLASRYPAKWDLTKNKVHTLSEQTTKVVKSIHQTVKATYFAKGPQFDQFRPLLDDYKGLNPKFEVEFVDPDREPTRAKQQGIKKYGTLVLSVGTRESKIEDLNEEKLTNALIKLLKEKSPTLCAITGHGEKSFTSREAEGYETIRKSLADQSYEVKDVNILQEGKIPEACDAIAIIGPNKAFFPAETKILSAYFTDGGRGIIAIDLNLKGGEYAPELLPILQDWHVKPAQAMIVDPISRMFGQDASVAVLASFSKENPITKDFRENCLFPLARPLDILPNAPTGLHVEWLAQTTPKSWAIADLKELEKGQVQINPSKDKPGPLTAAISVEGKQKESKATKNTRLVVFGTSYFATNNFSRYAGNLDFFMNSVSWAMEDETLISIRAKEEGPGKVELSQKSGTFIFLLTVIVLPLVIAVGGLGIWIARKRL